MKPDGASGTTLESGAANAPAQHPRLADLRQHESIPADHPAVPVFFLSDSTGISAETMGNSLLIQFPYLRFDRRLIPFINSLEEARKVVAILDAAMDGPVTPLAFTTAAVDEIRIELHRSRCPIIDFFDLHMAQVESILQARGERVASQLHGVVHEVGPDDGAMRRWLVDNTNLDKRTGTLRDVLPGADVFIGVSAPNLLTGSDIAGMSDKAIVFGLANPVPEVDPVEAQQHAAVVATGRSDFPNQINNVLAFPGFFRGLLDGALCDITDSMLIAAANAIADRVAPDQLNASYIIPSVFDSSVAGAVAHAVRVAEPR